MPIEIPDETKALLQNYWNEFITLVRANLTELKAKYKEEDKKTKKIDRLELALRYRNDNPEFIMRYKDLLIELNPNFQVKFDLLEAFKRENNLDNDIAINIHNSIVHSENLVQLLEDKRAELIASKDELRGKLTDVGSLIDGNYYPYEIILEYIQKFKLSPEQHNAILFYGLSKSVERRETAELTRVKNTKAKEEAKIKKLEDSLRDAQQKYLELKATNAELISKYYNKITDYSSAHKDALFAYATMTDEELSTYLNESREERYEEVSAEVAAVKALKTQEEIENLLAISKEDMNEETLGLLHLYVEEYGALLEKIMIHDHNLIVTTPVPVDFAQTKVFYLTDDNGEYYIDEEFRSNGGRMLHTFEDKVENGDLLARRGTRVTHLMGVTDLESKIGKTIFMQKSGNGTAIISYVKLNIVDGTEINQGVLVIAATQTVPTRIKEITRDALRNNIDRVNDMIHAIQLMDPEEMKHQQETRSRIFGN